MGARNQFGRGDRGDGHFAGQRGDHGRVMPVDDGYNSISGVSGLPSARCFDRGTKGDDVVPRFMCVAVAQRYAFKVSANQDLDARQAAASQYLMLTS